MNAEQLLAHYELVAESPDATADLRAFVLELAFRGKLVPQLSDKKPGQFLLGEILKTREGLEKSRSLKRVALPYGPLPCGLADQLPSGWARSTLGTVCDLQTGATPDTGRRDFFGGDIPWLVSGDINRGEIFDCDGRITELALSASNCKVLPRDCVLIALNGQGKTRGMVALLRIPATCNQSLVAIIPLRPDCLSPEYLSLNLKSRYRAIRTLTGGDERRGLNMRLISCFEISIPPIAEQHRIVAKVDELMALCDRLEAARAQREATRDRLTGAILARLNTPEPAASPVTDPPKASSFVSDARFALEILPAITYRPDQIKRLRKAVLNLAVRGKLVEQNGADGEVNTILTARDSQARSRTRRGVPDAVPIPEVVQAWGLPQSWCVRAAADLLRCGVLLDLKDGNHGANHPKVSDFSDIGTPFITAAQVRDHQLDFDGAYKLSGPPLKRLRIGFALKGDVIFTHKGTVGRVAIAQGDCVLSPQTTYYRPDVTIIDRKYLMWYLESDLFSDQVDEVKKQTTRDFVAISKQYEFFHAIPPLPEQHRIVAKVDQLMSLCDRLEASLSRGEKTRSRLLDALLHEALAPAETTLEAA